MKLTTAQLLTIGTSKLWCPIGEVYETLNGLTGDNLFTHVLPRAMRVCEPWVKKQFPWLADVGSPPTPETFKAWIADISAEHGETHEVKPLPQGVWIAKDPIKELGEIMEGYDRIIVVKT